MGPNVGMSRGNNWGQRTELGDRRSENVTGSSAQVHQHSCPDNRCRSSVTCPHANFSGYQVISTLSMMSPRILKLNKLPKFIYPGTHFLSREIKRRFAFFFLFALKWAALAPMPPLPLFVRSVPTLLMPTSLSARRSRPLLRHVHPKTTVLHHLRHQSTTKSTPRCEKPCAASIGDAHCLQ